MAIHECLLMKKETWKELLKDIETVLFDGDGVLWRGSEPISGSPELVQQIADMGKRILVLSNNSTQSRAAYAKKCLNLGYNSIKKDQIVNTPIICVEVLKKFGFSLEKKIYLIGTNGLIDELTEAGYKVFGHGSDHFENYSNCTEMNMLSKVPLESNVGAVIIGFDSHFSYVKLMKAANYITNADCLFIVTNEDSTFPGLDPDVVIPGTGSMVAAVKTAVDKVPLCVGKPDVAVFDYLKTHWNINPSKTMIIGDRCDTDVAFGGRHGLRTMLVLTGVHGLSHVQIFRSSQQWQCVPDFYAESLADLIH